MTICIAAICGEHLPMGAVIGVADRMKTSGDIQFEPQIPKVFAITNSINIMTAGDAALQAEIIQEIHPKIRERIKSDPGKWIKVKDVAELYLDSKQAITNKRIERQILSRFSLNQDSFLAKQKDMSPAFVRTIGKEILNFRMPTTSIIACGVDDTGYHIYVVNSQGLNCMDTIGFAAIGIGQRHAESQFMFSGHTPINPVQDTLLLAYSAKKRAEVSPGVGKATDMFIIGPNLGQSSPIKPELMNALETSYHSIKLIEASAIPTGTHQLKEQIDFMNNQAKATPWQQEAKEGELQ